MENVLSIVICCYNMKGGDMFLEFDGKVFMSSKSKVWK